MIGAASAMPATVSTMPTANPSAAVSSATSQMQTLTQNDFLSLLTAQLRHQDPLSPMSGAEFAAQLAQFATATGVQGLQTSLNSLGGTMAGLQAAGLVGHSVAVPGNALALGASGAATGALNLSAAASSVKVTVSDANGRAVATLDLAAKGAGLQTFTWDGTAPDGTRLPPGNYSFKVTASGMNGAAVTATPSAVAPVIAVTLGGQAEPMVNLGGGLEPVPLTAVQQIF
jgi:flagellar basal-body rod modification protein FlgD